MASINGHAHNGVALNGHVSRFTFPKSEDVAAAMAVRDAGNREDRIKKGFAVSLRSALGGGAPGYWSQDHFEQTQHYTGWNYVAARSLALQLAKATVAVYQELDDAEYSNIRKSLGRIRKDYDNEKLNQKALPKTHRLVKLLNRPNPKTAGATFRYEASLQLSLTGVVLIWHLKNQVGKTLERYVIPTALAQPQPPSFEHPMGAWKVTPLTNYNGYNDDYLDITGYGAVLGKVLDARHVEMIRWPHPLYKGDGYGPLAGGGLWSDSADMVDSSRWHHLKQGPDPSINVSPGPDVDMDADEMERAAAKFNAKYSGPDKAGKAMFTSPGTTVTVLGQTAVEMAYEQAFIQLRDSILALHGTPPIAAGVTEGGSYANFVASLRQYISLTVQPLLNMLAEEDTEHLAPEFGPYTITYEAETVDDPDMIEKELSTDISAGNVRTVKEYRKVRGLPPFGDERDDVFAGAAPAQPEQPGMPGESQQPNDILAAAQDPFKQVGANAPNPKEIGLAAEGPIRDIHLPNTDAIKDAAKMPTATNPGKPKVPVKWRTNFKGAKPFGIKKSVKKCSDDKPAFVPPGATLDMNTVTAITEILDKVRTGNLASKAAVILVAALGVSRGDAEEMVNSSWEAGQPTAANIVEYQRIEKAEVLEESIAKCDCDECQKGHACPCGNDTNIAKDGMGMSEGAGADGGYAVDESIDKSYVGYGCDLSPEELDSCFGDVCEPDRVSRFIHKTLNPCGQNPDGTFTNDNNCATLDGSAESEAERQIPKLKLRAPTWEELLNAGRYPGYTKENFENFASKMKLGRNGAEKLRRLIVCPPGSKIELHSEQYNGVDKLSINVTSRERGEIVYPDGTSAGSSMSLFETTFSLARYPYDITDDEGTVYKAGTLGMYGDYARTHPSQRQTAILTRCFGQQVKAARQLGAQFYKTDAARSDHEGPLSIYYNMTGYETWPKLGFSALITRDKQSRSKNSEHYGKLIVNLLREHPNPLIRDAKTIRDLYKTREGQHWWAEHGSTTTMVFNMDPNSSAGRQWGRFGDVLQRRYQDTIDEVDRAEAAERETAPRTERSGRVGRPRGRANSRPILTWNGHRSRPLVRYLGRIGANPEEAAEVMRRIDFVAGGTTPRIIPGLISEGAFGHEDTAQPTAEHQEALRAVLQDVRDNPREGRQRIPRAAVARQDADRVTLQSGSTDEADDTNMRERQRAAAASREVARTRERREQAVAEGRARQATEARRLAEQQAQIDSARRARTAAAQPDASTTRHELNQFLQRATHGELRQAAEALRAYGVQISPEPLLTQGDISTWLQGATPEMLEQAHAELQRRRAGG